MEMERVYCEVRTIFFYIVYMKFRLQNVTKLKRYVIPCCLLQNVSDQKLKEFNISVERNTYRKGVFIQTEQL